MPQSLAIGDELPLVTGWRKPSLSNTLNNLGCVEVADTADGGLAIRDGKQGPDGPVLVFDAREVAAFFADIRSGALGHFPLYAAELNVTLAQIVELFAMPFSTARPTVLRGAVAFPENLFGEVQLQQVLTDQELLQRAGLFRDQKWLKPEAYPEAYTPEGVQSLRTEGITMVLRGLQRVLGPLRDLCQDVMEEGGWPAVHATAVETPPGVQGLMVHYDPNGTLAAQIRRDKTWWVFPPVVGSFAELVRTLKKRGYGSKFTDAEMAGFAKERAVETFTLHPGDMAFVPAGWGHYCEGTADHDDGSQDGRSLHAVVSALSPPIYTKFGNEDHEL